MVGGLAYLCNGVSYVACMYPQLFVSLLRGARRASVAGLVSQDSGGHAFLGRSDGSRPLRGTVL